MRGGVAASLLRSAICTAASEPSDALQCHQHGNHDRNLAGLEEEDAENFATPQEPKT
jgi:hypothetical protein